MVGDRGACPSRLLSLLVVEPLVSHTPRQIPHHGKRGEQRVYSHSETIWEHTPLRYPRLGLRGRSLLPPWRAHRWTFPTPTSALPIAKARGRAPGTPIAPSDIARLTDLEAGNANITNLARLELATNLQRLDLGYAKVGDEWEEQ